MTRAKPESEKEVVEVVDLEVETAAEVPTYAGEAEEVETTPIKEPSQIYLGPNLPGGRLLQSTVFRGGIPAYLEMLLVERPEVAELIVPVQDMAVVQARILQKGTAEYVAYQAILGKEQ